MISGKKVLAITLARGGSVSVPRKNIIDVCGQPLIQYTIDEVMKSAYVDDYYVSTDDEEIGNISSCLGVKVIKRPDEFATSASSSSSALIHAVQHLRDKGLEFYYIVEVMATNPLKTVEDIDGCIKKLDESGASSVVSVAQVIDFHPARIKYLENDVMKDFYPEVPESRRQDLKPLAFIRNGSVYAMKYSFLMESWSRYDKESLAYIMPSERTINIDEPNDLLGVRAIVEGKNKSV